MESPSSKSVVAVVTGASRGAGRGIAQALGREGATVYVTGRSQSPSDSPYGGTVAEAADLITVGLRSHYVASSTRRR